MKFVDRLPLAIAAPLLLLVCQQTLLAQQPPYGQPPQAGPMAVAAPAASAPAQGSPSGIPGAAAAPTPPFILDPIEQQYVFQTLQMWEAESSKINTFNADFERYEYDDVWGPGNEVPNIISTGTLSYAKPDKGSFKVDEIRRWTKNDPQNAAPNAPGAHVLQKNEVGEHWVCDGKHVYEYDHRNKQLVVTPIPPEMQGKAIVDGPLPFLFGAEARKLVERYWIRVNKGNPQQIWLAAFPKQQADAANYDSVEVMLDRKTMQPTAIQVHLPGGHQRHVYKFSGAKINGKLDAWLNRLFGAPDTPIGWKRVVHDPAVDAGQQAANPAANVQR